MLDQEIDSERERKRFLINIIIQEVILNDQIENIVFFKDVTFGVLYEQIKVSEKLSNFINDTLSQKIEVPLDSLIKTCN